ncbi:hypothetical protein [Georgenia sp. Marseille-Q6866]
MSVVLTDLPAQLSASLVEKQHHLVDTAKTRFDNAVVRYDAWWLVFVAVLLALGFVLVAGAAIWCLTKAGGRRFTGGMTWKNGFSLWIECR